MVETTLPIVFARKLVSCTQRCAAGIGPEEIGLTLDRRGFVGNASPEREPNRIHPLLDHFFCRWDSRSWRSVAFSLGKTPMEVGASHYTHRENAFSLHSVRWQTAWSAQHQADEPAPSDRPLQSGQAQALDPNPIASGCECHSVAFRERGVDSRGERRTAIHEYFKDRPIQKDIEQNGILG